MSDQNTPQPGFTPPGQPVQPVQPVQPQNTAARVGDAANRYLETSDRVTNGVKSILAQIWGGVLVVLGILALVLVGPELWWFTLILVAYGAYLIVPSKFLPFRKIVIW